MSKRKSNKKVKQMICDLMSNKFEQRFRWYYYALMAEYDNPFDHSPTARCWFEFDMPIYMKKLSLTANQLNQQGE